MRARHSPPEHSTARLPHTLNAVSIEHFVRANQVEFLHDALRRQKSVEWITVINPDLANAPATEVTREHFEVNLQAKGFVIVGEENEKPAERGEAETKEEE